MKTEILEVEWLDACSRDSWGSEDFHSDMHSGLTTRTIGYVLRDDKQGVLLAQAQNSVNHYCASFFIPRGMIKKVWRIK